MIYAPDCICGRHLLQRENEGTCLLCGHGLAHAVSEHAYRRNMARAPMVAKLDEAEAAIPSSARQGMTSASRKMWTADACIAAAQRWEQIHGHLPRSHEWDAAGYDRPTYMTVRRLFGGWPAFRREIADVPRERVAA